MYISLQKMIEAGDQVAFMIIDSPHQNRDYAPYVVEHLVKKTPARQIPYLVLEQLGEELMAEGQPKPKSKWRFWK